jgi:protein-S-isoprenylcysteine O-methyltransferase Ste14
MRSLCVCVVACITHEGKHFPKASNNRGDPLMRIQREEKQLEQKFGEEFVAYKKQVRCWL